MLTEIGTNTYRANGYSIQKRKKKSEQARVMRNVDFVFYNDKLLGQSNSSRIK